MPNSICTTNQLFLFIPTDMVTQDSKLYYLGSANYSSNNCMGVKHFRSQHKALILHRSAAAVYSKNSKFYQKAIKPEQEGKQTNKKTSV